MPHVVVRAQGHTRSRSLGWLAVRWIEHFVIHGPGDIMGRPMDVGKPDAIPLSDELTMLTVDAYALNAAGERMYDSVFFSRPKGADKSGQASRIALFEALGPCRFEGWAAGGEIFEWMDFRHVYEPGEPMGRRITYPYLRILATEEGQTGNVYDAIYYNLDEGPLREAFARRDNVGLTRVFLPDGGEIRPSTASSSAKDGGKETWANFDETHLYNVPELRRMYDTVRRNMTKRKDAAPWSFESSTMYQPGQDSIAERSHQLAEMMMQKNKLRMAPRYFFDHREAPADLDLTDEKAVRSGLADAYGDSWPWQDQDRKVREIMDPRNDVADTRRYALNQVTAAHDAWLSPQQYDACVQGGYVVADGALITLGLDGSESDDHTVLTACEVETGYEWPLGIWDPTKEPGGKIPKASVDKAVRDAMAQFDVVGFYSDVHPFEDYIDRWEEEIGETLCARATQLHPIKWDMRAGGPSTKMIEAYHTAIIDHVDIFLHPDRSFRWYHINARRAPNIHGVSVAKGKHEEKIDAVPSAALARKARQDYMVLPENKKRVKQQPVGVFFA